MSNIVLTSFAPSLTLDGNDFYGIGYLVTEAFLQWIDNKTVRQEYLSTLFEGIPAPPFAPGLPIFISKHAVDTKILPLLKSNHIEAFPNIPASHSRYRVFISVGNKVINSPFIIQDNILDIDRSAENTEGRSIFDLKDLMVTTKNQSQAVSLSSVLVNDQAKFISAVTWSALHQIVKEYGEMIAIQSGEVVVAKNENLSKIAKTLATIKSLFM